MTNTFKEQADLFLSCRFTKDLLYHFNICTLENYLTLPAIHFKNYTDAFTYFYNITNTIQESCPAPNKDYPLNTSKSISDISRALENIADNSLGSLSAFCINMYSRAGIELDFYVCNESHGTLDSFYTDLTSAAKETFNAETSGNIANDCTEETVPN
jgi:hypothetical protein